MMLFQFTNAQLMVGAVVLVTAILIPTVGYMTYRKSRTIGFRKRFGQEYDREVRKHSSSSKAEAKLAGREARAKALGLREIDANDRVRFVAEWQAVQARFIEHPKSAVTQADELISSLLVARGYPKGSFDQRAADMSVSYPRVMGDYRRANAIAVRPGRANASTEELRMAMIQYGTIFDELVQAQMIH
jgi:hypothetical protein